MLQGVRFLGKAVITMSETSKRKEKCPACFSSLAYLAGYCPVCNDTGFVEAVSQQSLPEADRGVNFDAADPESSLEPSTLFI